MALSDAKRCTAIAKSTGKQCRNPARIGSDKCRTHGGNTPRGEASPNFKHGKFSDYMPERLVRIYQAVQEDEEHTILNRNIKLRETFIREKLAMIDDAPDSAETWRDFKQVWKNLKSGFANENLGMVKIAIDEGDVIINEREAYHKTVAELRDEMAEQRKDKQAISAIEYKGENAITSKELMTLMGGVLHVIQTIVTDKQQRIKIADGIDSLIIGETSPIVIDS